MRTLDIELTPKMAALVEQLVASGEYLSASDVIQEALERLQQKKLEEREKLGALRAAIDVGWQEAERGEHSALDIDGVARSVIKRDAA